MTESHLTTLLTYGFEKQAFPVIMLPQLIAPSSIGFKRILVNPDSITFLILILFNFSFLLFFLGWKRAKHKKRKKVSGRIGTRRATKKTTELGKAGPTIANLWGLPWSVGPSTVQPWWPLAPHPLFVSFYCVILKLPGSSYIGVGCIWAFFTSLLDPKASK